MPRSAPHHHHSFPHVSARPPYFLATLLCPGLSAHGEIVPQNYDYSYQFYREDGNRMEIESHYIRGQVDIDDATSFRFQWLNDAISGASPTGVLPGDPTQPFLSDVEDVRTGILGALSRQFGDHRVELEISRSSEDDYVSHGFALTDTLELNQKNTTLAYGLNYLDDEVSVPLYGDRRKESFDLFTGVTQILDKNTVVSANLTVGYANGYLDDPYKVIQRNEILQIPNGAGGFIDIPITNVYRENRPDSRLREVLQFEGRRYFEPLDGALDAVLRLSNDDYGVFSETLQVEWRQNVMDHFQVIPFFRYYHQNAADFFMTTLNDLNIGTPAEDPHGNGPNYSADYRLSSFDAISLGLRLRYQINDHFAASATYERYSMSGSGSDSSTAAAYADADMWTFGVSASF